MTVLTVPPQARWPRARRAVGERDDLGRLPPDLWRALAGDEATRERYQSKTYRRGPGQCAYWLGSLSSSGHGRLRAGTRGSDAERPGSLVVVAHVYGYVLSRGLAYVDTQAGHLDVIRHRGDEPSCQNPGHWVSGSYADNARDYAAPVRAGGIPADRPARASWAGQGRSGRRSWTRWAPGETSRTWRRQSWRPVPLGSAALRKPCPSVDLGTVGSAAYRQVMASKRRNPKKNKAARRRRPDMPGLRRARFELDDIYHLMSASTPEVLPLFGLTGLLLWNMAEDRAAAAHCVDSCLVLHYALAEYGIASRIEAVTVCVEDTRPGARPGTMYGEHPRYNADGTFNGHTILVVTGAGRLIDPTIQQFAEVPDSRQAMLPLIGPLPVPEGLGRNPIGVPRENHMVLYVPLPAPLRETWRAGYAISRADEFRQAGANLAANTLAVLQIEGIREIAARVPYPRLRRLLTALDGMTPVADAAGGFRFADPATGREIRLSEVS